MAWHENIDTRVRAARRVRATARYARRAAARRASVRRMREDAPYFRRQFFFADFIFFDVFFITPIDVFHLPSLLILLHYFLRLLFQRLRRWWLLSFITLSSCQPPIAIAACLAASRHTPGFFDAIQD
jgi:hypothetical protein